jgi:Carboxypeptidase regulatory-like domain
MSRTHHVLIAAIVTQLGAASAAAFVGPSATIVGTVTLTAADEDTFSGEGARVTLTCAADGTTRTEVSDEHGAFRFLNVPVDSCSIEADVQGFVAPPVTVVTAADEIVGADLHLGTAPLRVGVNVGGAASVQEPKMLRRSRGSGAGRRLERSPKECSR